MAVDELATMSGKQMHPPAARCAAVPVGQVRYYQTSKLPIHTADADPKNAFNIEAFLSTRLTVKPGDTFVTFETDEREEEEPS